MATGDKMRTSGLYIDRRTYEAIERLRERRRPVPTFNRQLLDLLHEILVLKGALANERWLGNGL